jgi:hypothetical protein
VTNINLCIYFVLTRISCKAIGIWGGVFQELGGIHEIERRYRAGIERRVAA